MAYRKRTGRLGYTPDVAVSPTSVPASTGGINALDPLVSMPPEDCIFTYNLMPVEYGLRLRKGYREWATGVLGDVRTILNYESNTADVARDRLWAVSQFGIYDVTTFNTTTPSVVAPFAVQGEAAGYGVNVEFTTDANEHYMFYADELNGLWQYSESTQTWTVPTSGTNPGDWQYDDPNNPGTKTGFPVEDIAFVMVHKLRIWVILKDSSDGWYLPIRSVGGELKKFTFGAKMTHGGDLRGLWTWTIDGGIGIDDYMIAVSRGGDVMVYTGGDPEVAEQWQLTGVWFIGEVPESRRITAFFGSEFYLLSTFGVSNLRDLLQGAQSNSLRQSPSAKINRFLRTDVESGKDRREWALTVHPGDGFMQIIVPQPASSPPVQYNQNLLTKAWGLWSGVPVIHAQTWNGDYFIGSADGVVYIYDGTLDGTTLAEGGGSPIEYQLLTSFQAHGAPHSNYKQVGLIRSIGIAGGTTNFNIRAVYDYDVEAALPPPPSPAPQAGDNWDQGEWDTAVWDYALQGESQVNGSLGLGRTFAIAATGNATARINVVGWDATFVQGGLL